MFVIQSQICIIEMSWQTCFKLSDDGYILQNEMLAIKSAAKLIRYQKFYSIEIVIITDRCIYHINTVLERGTSLILNIALH